MEIKNINCPTFERVLVTVGTTEFDELILLLNTAVFVDFLETLNCKTLVLQFGRGSIPDNLHDICDKRRILYRPFRFQPDLHEEMQKADLIISHCGAGSIIEAIDLMKPLIVVVNSSLQGNHQGELSDKLSDGGHCLATTTSHLFDCLQKIITCEIEVGSFMRPFPPADLDLFPAVLTDLFDF